MTAPKVSVIIPCHNLGRYLDEAVGSVLNQTFTDFEILIVDDGSTDPGTIALLADYHRPRTTVYRTEHRGLAAARNYLVARARGTWLSALDADDRFHPEFLAKTIAPLESDPDLTFCSCWLETFGTESWVWKPERCDLPALLAECVVATPAPVRREAVLAVGGYDERMPAMGDEDWDLWLTLVERGYRGAILPEALFFYRRRPDSMSSVCGRGETRQQLMDYMVTKHAASYHQHLEAVLTWKDDEVSDLLRGNHERERRLGAHLEPELARHRALLDRLRPRLAAAETARARQDAAERTARELAAATEALAACRTQLDAATRKGEAARQTAAAERHRADEAAALLVVRDRDIDALRRALDENADAAARARAEAAALLASTSWRLTSPLRAAARFGKRLLRGR